MKFGLFYEHQLPKPYDEETWGEDDEHKILKNALDQVELADKLGYDYVFEVEHHFLEEYSHSSAPEIFLAAASQRTKNIRLGHGIALMPPRYNHPARVAERISTLDLISDGRVEFGTGESASEMELGGFGVAARREEADVGRGDARVREDDDAVAVSRLRRRVLRHAVAQRRPEAAAEAAPAALGRVVAPRDDDGRRASRHGLARLRVRDAGRGAGARRAVLRARARGVHADRRRDQPSARRAVVAELLRDRRRGDREGPRRDAVLQLLARLLLQPARRRAPAFEDAPLPAVQGHAGRKAHGRARRPRLRWLRRRQRRGRSRRTR